LFFAPGYFSECGLLDRRILAPFGLPEAFAIVKNFTGRGA